jgi:predicted chitinase
MGRGPIQITGRANYKRYGDLLDLPLVANPEMAETPEVAFRVAGAFWKTHGLNELADKQMFKTITKRINGGYNGLDDRVKYYGRAKKVLAV